MDLADFDGTDITVSGDLLYFTSQTSKSIRAAGLATGEVTDIVTNVTKPGRVFVYEEDSADEKSVSEVSAATDRVEPQVVVRISTLHVILGHLCDLSVLFMRIQNLVTLFVILYESCNIMIMT